MIENRRETIVKEALFGELIAAICTTWQKVKPCEALDRLFLLTAELNSKLQMPVLNPLIQMAHAKAEQNSSRTAPLVSFLFVPGCNVQEKNKNGCILEEVADNPIVKLIVPPTPKRLC
jgi:hypothetical protein